MQSYCYHLKIELYATPDPTTTTTRQGDSSNDVWLPGQGADIFGVLPEHPRRESDSDVDIYGAPEAGYRAAQGGSSGAAVVIDCGAGRAVGEKGDDEGEAKGAGAGAGTGRGGEGRRAQGSFSPPPGFKAGIGPRTAGKDWRFGRVRIESFDSVGGGGGGGMAQAQAQPGPAASLGPNFGGNGQATRGRFVMMPQGKNTEAGWGVVHLYREADEERALGVTVGEGQEGEGEEDGTVLCIPAVPSYLSPGDFLGFIGEKWRGDVSHYRMVMTSRLSRYMVLMKFRDARIAKEWRKEFDGKPFDNLMESEICHVTFIKSITVEAPSQTESTPKGKQNDTEHNNNASSSSTSSAMMLRPFPPPTPNLIELPTCPVCLERMDDTTGLMTILCQHVFHCTCLQTWKGSGCPVCRATNPQPTSDPDNPYSQPFGSGVSNLCSVCDSDEDLWICLICGNVGCGRYKGGHAKDHWKETAHSFSLELETQHVWDYAGDMWVHRLIRDKGDGKVVDFSSNNNNSGRRRTTGQDANGEDLVPRAKLDGIGMEYAHLLTSQLESQRIYFEEMVNKAADKAAMAASAAESANAQAKEAVRETALLREEYRVLKEETVPSLEKDLARERNRANKSTELARNLGKSLKEEKTVSQGLMERIEHVNQEVVKMRLEIASLKEEKEELEAMNRDLTMFISGQQKLKELESEGKIDAGELEGGTLSVHEEKKKGKGKGKGRK
ncbi:hypothetical protein B0T16DRAFT_334718 [Cercophora newfieldiana]|uniref:Uncharacterized protein n=1 Tax=Cercophora newfieldiana TaxID=92897 RepID=A0AA40CL97_9PEZI|nr:hypothetical protein B0T16DRAFT_334718 [Cercophora newfieldiana]